MNIHWIQHVDFEGLGCMGPWLDENGHIVSCTRCWAGESLPESSAVDGLIVMGGPMGIGDEVRYPWLTAEKEFIKAMIDQGKPVLGICLGAQLIADVLGATVRPGKHREIGFHSLAGDGSLFPETFTAFHWHGDTFGVPDGAVHLAASDACANQAFIYNDHVLALQFHLETTSESLRILYANCADEVIDGPYIQSLEDAVAQDGALVSANVLMTDLLAELFCEA